MQTDDTGSDTVEFVPVGRAGSSLGSSYTSRRFQALGRETLETLTSSFASSQEARELIEIESRGQVGRVPLAGGQATNRWKKEGRKKEEGRRKKEEGGTRSLLVQVQVGDHHAQSCVRES